MTIYLKPFSDIIALATGNPSRVGLTWDTNQKNLDKLCVPKTILVTGANGFVGLHIIRELTARKEVTNIVAFVRARSDVDGLKRLLVAARRFGLIITNQEKIKVYGTSFSKAESLPLMQRFSNEVDAVIHTAGSTSHIRSYFYYRKESVLPLSSLMRFSRTGKTKSLHVIGSIGSDIYMLPRDFFRLNFFYCGYSRMKWVTRCMTLFANKLGLPITMYLPSYVIGSSCTDYRDPGMRYAFWQILRLCNDLNMIWDSGDDVISVVTGEDLARSIVNNVFEPGTEACVYPSSLIKSKDLAERFNWQHVPWSVFYKTLRKKHKLLKFRSLSSFKDALAVRVLFPRNLPEIINRTSRSVDMSKYSPEIVKDITDTMFNCAQRNYLFNLK